jgi:hypothetical protein
MNERRETMPTTWRCTSCRLVLPVGWFHYGRGAQPYWAATLLVCSECGTAHAVEHAIRDSGCGDRLFHLSEPYFDDCEPDVIRDDEKLEIKWLPGSSHIRHWHAGGETGRYGELENLQCVHCGTYSLTDRWGDKDACPSCVGRHGRGGFLDDIVRLVLGLCWERTNARLRLAPNRQ